MVHIKEIETRNDIEVLINSFYAKIRKDALLGPIFNTQIPEDKWSAHLINLTDFWETNLFGVARFKGNPTKMHVEVDKNFNYEINQVHFGKWLQLWFETIDELYQGDYAKKAKDSARKISTRQFLAMWNNRPQNIKEVE